MVCCNLDISYCLRCANIHFEDCIDCVQHDFSPSGGDDDMDGVGYEALFQLVSSSKSYQALDTV